jgi:hypothetical protein
MGIFSKLFGRTSSSPKDSGIHESNIIAIIVVVGSPDSGVSKSDAIAIYAHKNPSWSRSHPIDLLHTSKLVPPTFGEGLPECTRVMVESETIKSAAPCTVISQTTVVEILNKKTGERSIKAPVGIFTVLPSQDGKNTIALVDGSLDFSPEQSRIRTE